MEVNNSNSETILNDVIVLKTKTLLEENQKLRNEAQSLLNTPTKTQKVVKKVSMGLWVFVFAFISGIGLVSYALNTNTQNNNINNAKIEVLKKNDFNFAKAQLDTITQTTSTFEKQNNTKDNEDEDFELFNVIDEEVKNTLSWVSHDIMIKNTYLDSKYKLLTQNELKKHFVWYTTQVYPIRVKLERFIQDVEGKYMNENNNVIISSTWGLYVFENNKKIDETQSFTFNVEELKNNKFTFIAKDIYKPLVIETAKRFPKWIKDPKKQESNNANSFKGILEFSNNEIINELDLEQYVRGIGESATWTAPEKMKMQAILARSYAFFYMYSGFKKFKDANYILTDNPANSQKYMGAGVNNGENWQNAAKETFGEILVDRNEDLFIAPYSTCSYQQADGKVRRKTLAEAGWWEEKIVIDGQTKLKFGADVLAPVDDTNGVCKDKQSGGHGVGLSGNGAEYMASKEGKKAFEIISYYYKNVQIKNIFKDNLKVLN